jgi:hypothetical protein
MAKLVASVFLRKKTNKFILQTNNRLEKVTYLGKI